jgi:hypothetical protein
MNFEGIDIPLSLRPIKPTPPVDYIAAARRAEQIVAEIRSASERGALNRARAGRAIGELNKMMMEVGMEWNKVCGNERLFRVQQQRRRRQAVGPFGSLADVTAFSQLRNSYQTIHEAFAEIEILTEGLWE